MKFEAKPDDFGAVQKEKEETKLTKEGAWHLVEMYEMKAVAEPHNTEFYKTGATLLRELFSSAERGIENMILISSPPKGMEFADLYMHEMKPDEEFVSQIIEDQNLFMLINLAIETLSDGKMTFRVEGNSMGIKKR